MNTKHLKSYAPKARSQFMEAVAKRAAHFGIYGDEILSVTFEGSTAIIDGNAFTKEQGEQRKRLEKRVQEKGYELFIREMAYTWFNRLAALRYMELHDYLDHGFRVLSNPSNKDGLPEILDHAADVADMLALNKSQIIEWQLAGDKQEALYRELLLGQCHHLHSVMPFLFEAIDDATELLLPDNLTKTDSILKGLVNDIPEEDWQQIEVIGWLYQFYISEHKDAVIGKVVKSEDIPAATQLFTPNWIVKYLVQNSIGRQWLATYPESSIKAKMQYYIEPAEQTYEVKAQLAAITPSSIDPERIKALDPACGSGHILVEMYELLREIYLERGYRLREIPELILTKNIYGLDIDDRAAQLAGFALLMKAREDDRRIFQRVLDGSVKLNVYALQSTEGWDSASLWQSLNLDGKAEQGSSGDLFIESKKFDAPTGEYAEYFDLLKYLIVSFEQAKTLGSLIQIDHEYLPILEKFKSKLLEKLLGTDPAAVAAASLLLPVVEQATVLAQKYDAVIANPPYMGNKGMNSLVKSFAKSSYPEAKSDLFAMFIDRGVSLLTKSGHTSMVTMQSWLFLSSYEKFRKRIFKNSTVDVLSHLGPNAFPEITGPAIQLASFVLREGEHEKYKPMFSNNTKGTSECKKEQVLTKANLFSKYAMADFRKIPGNRLAYWIDEKLFESFNSGQVLEDVLTPRQGMATSDNSRFLRFWWEVSEDNIERNAENHDDAASTQKKWFPYNKGGTPKKWFGNHEYIVNWKNSGEELLSFASSLYGSPTRTIKNIPFYFKKGITWGDMTFKNREGEETFAARYNPSGYIFDIMGPSGFPSEEDLYLVLAILNSRLLKEYMSFMNPTSHFQVGDIRNIPFRKEENLRKQIEKLAKRAIDISKALYFRDETAPASRTSFLSPVNINLRSLLQDKVRDSEKLISELANIETNLDKLCYSLYEIEHDNRVTGVEDVTYSPYSIPQLVIQFCSYFIGALLGRYSVDYEGLVYAHCNNEKYKNLVTKGAYKSFPADDDGITPLASEEWLFEDDATTRFRKFVNTVWGQEHLQENLEFVAESLCLNAIKPKKGESAMETIRRYFSTQFFADHCKMYKKRPIYWLFSSGKEKAFECLVYLHRYNEATLSRMRTEYVTPLMGKYDHQLARKMEEVVEATGTEQRRIEKEIKDLEKKQAELRKFDEELKHYAEMRISLDLDDGVKANYGKFGNLLLNVKAIHGKAVK